MTYKSHGSQFTFKGWCFMPKDTFFNLPEDKQERIFKESIREFAHKGFEKGNIGEIAKKAGVAKGSMYQYFEDKKELYIYCIKKAYELSMKYTDPSGHDYENMSIYDYIYLSFKTAWPILQNDKELYMFLQDAAIGQYTSVKDEALDYILKSAREYMTNLIEKNKENGFIRSDIDTRIIMIYLEGVSVKIKERMLEVARSEGKEIYDMTFERYDGFIKDIISLLKNGMK